MCVFAFRNSQFYHFQFRETYLYFYFQFIITMIFTNLYHAISCQALNELPPNEISHLFSLVQVITLRTTEMERTHLNSFFILCLCTEMKQLNHILKIKVLYYEQIRGERRNITFN